MYIGFHNNLSKMNELLLLLARYKNSTHANIFKFIPITHHHNIINGVNKMKPTNLDHQPICIKLSGSSFRIAM